MTPWKGQTVFIEALNILNQQTFVKPFSAIILGSDQGRNVYYKKLLSLADLHSHRIGYFMPSGPAQITPSMCPLT